MGIQNYLDLNQFCEGLTESIDRNQFGGGLLVFIREDIPCSILNIKQLTIEALFIEINLRKKSGCYVAHTTLIKT